MGDRFAVKQSVFDPHSHIAMILLLLALTACGDSTPAAGTPDRTTAFPTENIEQESDSPIATDEADKARFAEVEDFAKRLYLVEFAQAGAEHDTLSHIFWQFYEGVCGPVRCATKVYMQVDDGWGPVDYTFEVKVDYEAETVSSFELNRNVPQYHRTFAELPATSEAASLTPADRIFTGPAIAPDTGFPSFTATQEAANPDLKARREARDAEAQEWVQRLYREEWKVDGEIYDWNKTHWYWHDIGADGYIWTLKGTVRFDYPSDPPQHHFVATVDFQAGIVGTRDRDETQGLFRRFFDELSKPTPDVPVAVATEVERLPRSEDNQIFARRHRAGEDGGETVEIRREELRSTRNLGRGLVCLVVPLDVAHRELIWDSEVWSGWDPGAVPSHDATPGSWIWSTEVTYRGQTWRTVYQTDEFDRGPVRHAFLTFNNLWGQGEPVPCPPTPSSR